MKKHQIKALRGKLQEKLSLCSVCGKLSFCDTDGHCTYCVKKYHTTVLDNKRNILNKFHQDD